MCSSFLELQQAGKLLPSSCSAGFPGGSEVKASACNVGGPGSIPELRCTARSVRWLLLFAERRL